MRAAASCVAMSIADYLLQVNEESSKSTMPQTSPAKSAYFNIYFYVFESSRALHSNSGLMLYCILI